jgi:hypothetical protein
VADTINADPVGIVEVAARLYTARPVVDTWRSRGVLPAPRWTVGGRPAWDWSDIVRWCHDTDRAHLLQPVREAGTLELLNHGGAE